MSSVRYARWVRTTIRLDDDLLAELRQRAAAERTTMTALIEDALRAMLARRSAQSGERLQIRPLGDAATLPGVELDDSASLRDRMDGLSR